MAAAAGIPGAVLDHVQQIVTVSEGYIAPSRRPAAALYCRQRCAGSTPHPPIDGARRLKSMMAGFGGSPAHCRRRTQGTWLPPPAQAAAKPAPGGALPGTAAGRLRAAHVAAITSRKGAREMRSRIRRECRPAHTGRVRTHGSVERLDAA